MVQKEKWLPAQCQQRNISQVTTGVAIAEDQWHKQAEQGRKEKHFNINKYSQATESIHLETVNGDLGKPLAFCTEIGEHAGDAMAWRYLMPLHQGAVHVAGYRTASCLPYIRCPFSAPDDLTPCSRVRKTHLCALVFLEGKGNLFKLQKSREVAGIF